MPRGAAGSAGAVVAVHQVASAGSTGEAAGGSARSPDVEDTPMGRLKHVADEGVRGLGQKHRELAQQVFDMCSIATHRFDLGSKVCLCVSNLKRGWQIKNTCQ